MNSSSLLVVSTLLASATFFVVGCEERKPSTSLKPNEEMPLPSQNIEPKVEVPPPLPNVAEIEKAKGSPPTSTAQKLSSQLVLALKKMRGEPPFDKPTTLEPDIPISDGTRVLIDAEAAVSEGLLNQIALMGGQVAKSPDSDHIIRAMIPLSQLEALAGREDIKSVSPTRLSISSGAKAEPPPQTDTSKPIP